MNEILDRLSILIIQELEKRNISCVVFAELCGISRNEMSHILNRRVKDIKLSTIYKICDNSCITIFDIFGVTDTEYDIFDKKLKKFYLTDGIKKYYFSMYNEIRNK